MPQLCTVCHHPQSREIDLEIIRGKQSNRAIACHFNVSRETVRRHRNEHLLDKIQIAQAIATKIERIDLNRELATIYNRTRSYLDACHDWLTDPDNPSKYTLVPRSEEITVIYEKRDGDKTIRGKAKLSILLKQVEDGLSLTVIGYQDRSSDIRRLFLRASGLLMKELHRIGDKLGLFTNKIINSEQLESLSIAVDDMRHEFKTKLGLDLSWEETIDRVIKYYPQKRVYLERLREDGPVHR
jgi:hypothetical protein